MSADLAYLNRFNKSRRFCCRILSVFALLAAFAGCSLAQNSTPDPQSSAPSASEATDQSSAPSASETPDQSADKEADTKPTPPAQLSSPGDPRQAQLVADTEKLLKLAQELKVEVAKSNKDTLSLAVVKKAEEVEKLAKSLKERMNKSH